MFPARSIPCRLRPLSRLLAGIGALLFATALHAQGIDYQVRIDAPRQLENMLEENLDLMRWRGNPRVDMEQLQRLVKEAPAQAKTYIATEGYYSPKISAGLDTSGSRPVARMIVDPGEPTVVGDVDLVLQGFAPIDKGAAPFDAGALRQRWQLPVGARFRQADWEGAKNALLRDVAQQRILGAFPVGLAEARAHWQLPALAQGAGVEGRRALVDRGEALQHQVDVADHGRLARVDDHARDGTAAAGIQAGGDLRRVVALGGDVGLGLGRGFLDQALQLFHVHARVAAPAHQVEVFLQHVLQLARGVDADLVVDALGVQGGREQQGAYAGEETGQRTQAAGDRSGRKHGTPTEKFMAILADWQK